MISRLQKSRLQYLKQVYNDSYLTKFLYSPNPIFFKKNYCPPKALNSYSRKLQLHICRIYRFHSLKFSIHLIYLFITKRHILQNFLRIFNDFLKDLMQACIRRFCLFVRVYSNIPALNFTDRLGQKYDVSGEEKKEIKMKSALFKFGLQSSETIK